MNQAWLILPLMLLIDSLHYVLGRLLLSHLPPVTSGLFVMAISTLEVVAFNRGRVRVDVFRRHWVFFLSIGCLVAVSTNLGYAAVKFIDPGTASLLSRTSLVFSLGLGLVWLRDRLSRLEAAGAVLALGGVFVVSFQPGDYLRLGSLLVLIGTFLYAVHAAVVKRWGGEMAFVDFFLFRLAATTAFLFVLSMGQGALVWPGGAGWALVALTGTVDVVIGRTLYYVALRRLDMSFHTIILTLSPVVTIGWSFALFGSRPSLPDAAGGLAVLAGVLLVAASKAGLLRAPRVQTASAPAELTPRR